MNNNMIMVESASDWTLVMNIAELNLHRTWVKRGQQIPIDRDILMQAYYDPSVESLFKEGALVVHDKEFLENIGLLNSEGESLIKPLDDKQMIRLIKNMPLAEFKETLKTLNHSQIVDLAEYAVAHYTDLKLDRADLLSKASGRNIMRSIENYKADSED